MPKILKEGYVSDNTTNEKPQFLDKLSSYICLRSYITTEQNITFNFITPRGNKGVEKPTQ